MVDGLEKTHDWELKGGARGEASKPSIPTGYALFQCRDCGLSATRQLTGRNSGSVSAIVPLPEIDQDCIP